MKCVTTSIGNGSPADKQLTVLVICCVRAEMLLVLQQEAPHMDASQSEFLKHGENACERSSNGINKILFPGQTRIQSIA